MKAFLLLVSVLMIACSEPIQPSTQTTKGTTAIIQKDTVQAKSAAGEVATFTKTLITDTAIPFLYEYEKQHKKRYVRIITDYGNIDIELFNETPYHRANFIFLTKQRHFNGTVFHRVVENSVIQRGNSESWDISRRRAAIGVYLLPPNIREGFKHHRDTVSMPNSNIGNPHQFASPCKFFIVVQRPGAYHLDGEYTASGGVTAGIEMADKINQVETEGRDDWPKEDIKMKVIILNK